MAPVTTVIERRREVRHAAGPEPRHRRALLRPGVPVTLVNVSTRAALLESCIRLRPGVHVEMQLGSGHSRICVRGTLDRCHVAALQPLTYRGVLLFESAVDVDRLVGKG
ncbi:MAG TPA: hypothetical protein VEC39_09180 [Vicinamibacterales bacterium]|nr:hypothetical protein [Vicinamibacterales bacterium]